MLSGYPVAAMSQKMTLKATNANLDQVFRMIKNNSGYGIAYNIAVARNITGIDLDVKDATVETVLDICLKNTNLSYVIRDGAIVVQSPQQPPGTAAQANPSIRGSVKNSVDGLPLPGVTVTVEGTKAATMTDQSGNFVIAVPEAGGTLVFKYLGYEDVRTAIAGRKVIQVTMREVNANIDNVVVTGYQQISKERATGSFGKLTQEQLDQTLAYSVFDKIEGLSGGVLFDPLGITIRGVSTLNANRMPLVVIDDFPISVDDVNNEDELAGLHRALESINPNDIASVTILKDAAAASIWGVRASNGVIVITTKRTSNREPEIEFTANYMVSPRPDVGKLPYSSPGTYLEMEMERYRAGWCNSFITSMDTYYYMMSDVVYYNARFMQGAATRQELNNALFRVGNIDNRYEFSDLFLRSKTQQQYNLSVRQSTTFNNYSFSASYDKINSIYKGKDNDRMTLNFQNMFKPSDYVQASVSVNLIIRQDDNNGMSFSDLFNVFPYEGILDQEGNYTSMNRATASMNGGTPYRDAFYEANKHYLPYDWEYNLKREFDNKNNSVRSTDLRIQTGITVKPLGNEDLKLAALYQYERSYTATDDLQNEETFYVRNLVNQYAQKDKTYPVPKGSVFDQSYGYSNSNNLRLTASYFKTIDRHQFVLFGGFEVRENYLERSQNRRYGFNEQTQTWAPQMNLGVSYPRNFYPTNAYTIESAWNATQNYATTIDRFLSYFGNAAYTLDDKYDVTGSIRLDKSNMFGRSKQYREVPLWSVGAGWLISKENFFNIAWVDRLRLRATYGSNGNVDKSTSPYAIGQVTGSENNAFIGLQGAKIINPANPLLRWEKTMSQNYGVDFNLLHNKVNGKIDYYVKRSRDLLVSQPMNSTLGFNTAKINNGEIKNDGFEIELSVMPVRTANWSWNSRIAYSYSRNTVVSGGPGDISTTAATYLLNPAYDAYRTQPGRPRFYLMGLHWAGLDENGYPQIYRYDETAEDRRKLLKWNDPYVSLKFADMLYIGGKQAPHFGSWTNTLNYKGFNLSFMIQYKFGHYYKHTSPLDVANNDLYGLQQGNPITHYHEEWGDRWRNPGDENHTDIPRLPTNMPKAQIATGYYSDMVNYGDFQFARADHIRFSRVTLSYRLPDSVLPKEIRNLVITGQATNIGYIAFNKWKEDPERLPDMYGSSLQRSVPEYTFSVRLLF